MEYTTACGQLRDTEGDTEEWRPVIGYEGLYSVSNFGKIRRDKSGRHTKIGKILISYPDSYGHLCVHLNKDGVGKTYRIHKLVVEAFIGPRPESMEIRHGINGRQNNFIDNLSYGTRKQNQLDRKRDETDPVGERNPSAKLTWKKVSKIRLLYSTGKYTQKQLGQKFYVSRAQIGYIINNKKWMELK